MSATSLTSFGNRPARSGFPKSFDLSKQRYKAASRSAFQNPEPATTLPPSNVTGNIDAPNGEIWYYIGEFDYKEIPPHDDVAFTDRILQEYTFTIYDASMKQIGVIKDKMDYLENEVRVPSCDITPVATRNFFNTDDKVEIMVALAVNTTYYVNNYRTLVYALGGEKDADGFDKPIDVLDNFVGDVIEGPSADGSDNFYITFMNDVIEEVPDETGFW
ncbi:MAG: hypothetical protein K2K81_04675, partial [Muribaculaceae bacterium]|nr:hypothetical protein [Muribaculaceae bacterium]